MEEHGGSIALLDAREVVNGRRGAMMRLTFPVEAHVEEPVAAEAAV